MRAPIGSARLAAELQSNGAQQETSRLWESPSSLASSRQAQEPRSRDGHAHRLVGDPPGNQSQRRGRPKDGANRSQPTAFDIAPDGQHAAVLSYKHAYYYARRQSESWSETLSRDPQLLAVPPMAHAEAVGFSRDGRSLFVTTEDRPALLFKIHRE